MKPKQVIFLCSVAAAFIAVTSVYRRGIERDICNSIYQHGKEEGIKEQYFKTKCCPPSSTDFSNRLNKLDKFREDTIQWLENMLLYDRIELQSIPRDIRTSSETVYIMAFRISKSKSMPCERFIKDMNTLCEDICSLESKDTIKANLVRMFSDYLNLNEHKEDELFVNFEKNLCEEILWEMQKRTRASSNNLEQQLKNHGVSGYWRKRR